MPPVYTDWDFFSEFASRWDFHRLLFAKLMNPNGTRHGQYGYWYHIDSGQLAQMNWPGVIFRPLKERIPADYILFMKRSR